MKQELSHTDKLRRSSKRLLKWSTFFVVLGLVPLAVNALKLLSSLIAVVYILILILIVVITLFLMLLNEDFRKMFNIDGIEDIHMFIDEANKVFRYVVPVLGGMTILFSVISILLTVKNSTGGEKMGRIVWASLLIFFSIAEMAVFYIATGAF